MEMFAVTHNNTYVLIRYTYYWYYSTTTVRNQQPVITVLRSIFCGGTDNWKATLPTILEMATTIILGHMLNDKPHWTIFFHKSRIRVRTFLWSGNNPLEISNVTHLINIDILKYHFNILFLQMLHYLCYYNNKSIDQSINIYFKLHILHCHIIYTNIDNGYSLGWHQRYETCQGCNPLGVLESNIGSIYCMLSEYLQTYTHHNHCLRTVSAHCRERESYQSCR